MRKFLIFLALLMLISASASAYVVTPSKTPNTKLGNAQGLYSVGTIKAPDLYATDDLLVVDDAQIYDDLIVNGTLTVGVFSTAANVTTGHVTEDLTMDSGVDITAASGAEIFNYGASTGAFTTGTGTNTLSGNTVISGSKTFTTGTGLSTFLGNIYISGTKTLTMGTGAAQFGGALNAANVKANTTLYSAGTLNSGGTATLNALKVNGTTYSVGALNSDGTATLNAVVANTTVSAPADGIRANSVILPGEMVITVPITKGDFAAGELNRSIFIADDAWTITSIEEVHNTAETTATTLALAVQKMTGTQALTGGINVTESAFNLKSTANTVVAGTLSTTSGRTTLADGNRLGIICNLTGQNAMGEFRGGLLTIHMKRV